MPEDIQLNLQMEYLERCPLCDSDKIRVFFNVNHMGAPLSFFICDACTARFLNPRMTDSQAEAYYKGPYRQLTLTDDAAKTRDRNVQEFRSRIQWTWFKEITKLETVQSHLEIGTSAGFLLKEVQASKTVGVDPDPTYRGMAPAVNFQIFDDLDQVQPHDFELVSMSHVLEHFNHPNAVLTQILQFAGKYVLVEVPNAEGCQHAYLIHHPIAYNQLTLKELFARHGFQCEGIGYHGLSWPINTYMLGLFKRNEEKWITTRN